MQELITQADIFKKAANKLNEYDSTNDIYGPLLTKSLCRLCLQLDKRIEDKGEQPRLTVVHSVCLKTAIESKSLLLVKPIVNMEYDGPENKLITKSGIVSFHLSRATIAIHWRLFKIAYQSLNICMNIPHTNSDLYIRSVKLYALTSILIDNRFKVPLGEQKDFARKSCSEYIGFANSGGSDIREMVVKLESSKETFFNDGLYEVAVLCLKERLLRVIDSLSNVYVSIRIKDIEQLPELKGFNEPPSKETMQEFYKSRGYHEDDEGEHEDTSEETQLAPLEAERPPVGISSEEKYETENMDSQYSNSNISNRRSSLADIESSCMGQRNGIVELMPSQVFGSLTQELHKFLFAGRLCSTIKHSSDGEGDVLVFKEHRGSVATYVNHLESLLCQVGLITKSVVNAGTDIVYRPEFARKVKFINKRGLEDSKVIIQQDILYMNATQRRKLSREDEQSSEDDRMTDE